MLSRLNTLSLFLLALLCVGGLFFAVPVYAIDPATYTFRVTGMPDPDGNCSTNLQFNVEIHAKAVEDDIPWDDRDWSFAIVYDGHGHVVVWDDFWGPKPGQEFTYTESIASAYVNPAAKRPFKVVVYDTSGMWGTSNHTIEQVEAAPILATDEFDPVMYSAHCASLPKVGDPVATKIPQPETVPVVEDTGPPPPPSDGRLCFWGTAGAVYVDSQVIAVYGINAQSQGYPAAHVTAEQLASLPATLSQDKLLASSPDGKYAIYKLAWGWYEVRAGADADGKVFTVMFSGLDADETTARCGEYFTTPNGTVAPPNVQAFAQTVSEGENDTTIGMKQPASEPETIELKTSKGTTVTAPAPRFIEPSLYIGFSGNTLFDALGYGRRELCAIPGGREYRVLGRNADTSWYQIEAVCNGQIVSGWIQAELGIIRNPAGREIPVQ